jgi:VWFA-related protein
MRAIRLLAMLGVLAAAVQAQAPPGPQQNPPAPPAPPSQQTAPTAKPPAPALKANTRLVTVDVVATDSHGKAVRDLKPEDFEVSEEHAGQQKIVKFQFVDVSAPSTAAPGGPPAPAAAPYVYTNLLPTKMRVPPTVILMDALNTSIQNQSEVHRQMVMLLKTLPPSTPIAVILLGHELHVLQNFTTDPALLRAAIDKTLRTPDIENDPQDDASSASNNALDLNGGNENTATLALEDFEKVAYEAQMAIRVDETTDAMLAISKFLGGYPGRKNLLWFSESFPSWLAPRPDFGAQPFEGTAAYGDKILQASQALTDARIAVYPVDARGLETDQLYTSASDPHINQKKPGAGFGGQIQRDSATRTDSQATMEQIAQQTGGKICDNTNDLSGCVQGALDDSSAYYELGYYPENVKWDGKFHKITVKSAQHGVKLRYRTGYFAIDPDAAPRQAPDKLLQQACMDPLSSTAISLTAESLTPQPGSGASAAVSARYLLTITPSSLTLVPDGNSNHVSLQMAICEYDPQNASFQFFPRDLSGPVSEAAFQSWQANGFRGIFDYQAKPDNRRLRFAVLDVPSGAIGSVDVPAHPTAFRTIAAAGAPPPSPALGAAPASAPAAAAPTQPSTHIVFHASTGETSALDWTGDSVIYKGDLTIGQGARALFSDLFGRNFHCDAGNLVSNDVTSAAKPGLQLSLRKPGGTRAQIDLAGDAPAYSGDVPVDSSGRAFFDYLWKLSHCQQP